MDNQNQQVPPVPSQEEAKASNNLSFLKIIAYGFAIVSVGVSIAIGGYLLGTSKSKSQPAAQISVTPVPSPAEASAKEGDPTANWKTYTVTKLGIEFKYPPNFSPIAIFDNELFPISFTDNSNTKHRLSTSPDISIKVIPIVSGDDYKTTLIKDVIFAGSGMHPKSFVEFSSKTIGGNMVYYIKTGLFEGVLSINYYLVNKNQVFAFNLTSSPVDWTNPNFKPEEDLLNLNMQQILSTFKFTN